jgi:hypothetical protein
MATSPSEEEEDKIATKLSKKAEQETLLTAAM